MAGSPNSNSTYHLVKYQALGNDYLVLDLPADLDSIVPHLPEICDRHFGVGSDGLLAFDPGAMSVRIFNPDASEAQKSGNGLRITACHAVLEHGAPEQFEIRTVDRANAVRVLTAAGPRVTCELDIGMPSFRAADLPARAADDAIVSIDTPAGSVRARLVSVGNPHCVVFDQPVSRERCVELGPYLERHPIFPERTNVQLVKVLGPASVKVEIWERGAGYTLASGTSASAVAAACMREGLVGDSVEVVMPGGNLAVRREAAGNLVQAGPAQRVCRTTIDLQDFEP